MSKDMTREEWAKAMIDGAIGIQSGNNKQRRRWYKGSFQVQQSLKGLWEYCTLTGLSNEFRTLTIVVDTKMTVKEIEQQLGITNLKIVGDK